ncbi:MAG: GNAT family N-acetyltransferase [Pseudomonadales bacterium]
MDKVFNIRDGSDKDLAEVLALNQIEAKWTSDLTCAGLASLISYANIFVVADVEDQVGGFLVVVPGTSAYPNDNLRWFRNRTENFWYIDRIVVGQSFSGMGIGKSLYNHAFKLASRQRIDAVVCEYSTVPMNEGSAAFHRRVGFEEIGIREDLANGKVLSMQSYHVRVLKDDA